MHAETPRLADKTIVFSEHEVFKVVVMVTPQNRKVQQKCNLSRCLRPRKF
jgi:hypothetical protein